MTRTLEGLLRPGALVALGSVVLFGVAAPVAKVLLSHRRTIFPKGAGQSDSSHFSPTCLVDAANASLPAALPTVPSR